jgi:hypothetical protein
MKFPSVSGSNLLRQKVSLPEGFKGELNIVCIAFQQWHQALVDSWVPLVEQITSSMPQVQFYELPTIYQMNVISRTFINEGMRAGIPNAKTREHTITLYLDKLNFRKALDIANEDTIYLLVIDRNGEVCWRTDGPYSEEKGRALAGFIESY